jgi:hypothetical protein
MSTGAGKIAHLVIPAQAGIQFSNSFREADKLYFGCCLTA